MAKSLPRAVERLLRGLLRRAIAAADDDVRPLGERVHELRTALKKAKALLRLAESLLGKRGRRERRKLAAVARRVGSTRDAAVVVETFERLAPRGGHAAAETHQRLVARRREAEHSKKAARELRRAGRALRSSRRRANGLLQRGDACQALVSGFTNEYRRARTALNRARRRDTPEAFHEWRKTVKTHAYHVAVLAGAGLEELRPRAAPLLALGETLGAAHDLTLLEISLGAEEATPHRALLAKLRARRRALDAEALALGRRLFSEPPSALRRVVAGALALERLDPEALVADR